MSELKEFRLPDVGEGLTEADIVRWHIQPGDKVSINQVIVEIETAKAVVELPCPYEGVVASLLVPEGATADVGTPIISVTVGDGPPEKPPAPAAVPPQGASAAAAPEKAADTEPAGTEPADTEPAGTEPAGTEPADVGPNSVLVGYGVRPGATTRRPRKTPAAAAATPAAVITMPVTTAPASTPVPGGVIAKPPVRKLARDLGIDLSGLSGTGPGGSITRDDVQSAAAGPDSAVAAEPAPAVAVALEERIPVRGVRKHTADAVATSAFTAPHVTEFLQVDITETMDATARLRELPEFTEVRVSPLLLLARALLVAVSRHPMINSSWDEAAQEIVIRHYVNLGIAAATDRGLIVPNIKNAHALPLPSLARALTELAQTARAGKTTPAELQGGTITITNVGVFGVDAGTPILAPGEAAILAFGQVRDGPWVHRGELAVRKVTTLALSFDHRIVDGDLGSAVLRDVGAMLEDPLRILAWS
jgi:pyruvate dehydrogenase E2 component (dihydrolipoamide acetyltransferase)